MKFKKALAIAVLALSAASVSAQERDNLTSTGGVLVKNSSGNCVLVKGNQNLTECGGAAPAPAVAEPAPVAAAAETVIDTVSLSADAYFDFNKYNLKPAGRQAIGELAQQLAAQGAQLQAVTVVGHTDSKGSDAYNQKLSERRALSVANFLVESGVPQQLITAYGEGERNPVADNSTDAGRAQNRRVDIVVQGLVQRQK